MILLRKYSVSKSLLGRRTERFSRYFGVRGDALGRIQPGYCADIVAFRTDDIAMAGGQSDPLASLVFCTPPRVNWSIINGRVVIEEGHLLTRSQPHIIEEQNRMAEQLMS